MKWWFIWMWRLKEEKRELEDPERILNKIQEMKPGRFHCFVPTHIQHLHALNVRKQLNREIEMINTHLGNLKISCEREIKLSFKCSCHSVTTKNSRTDPKTGKRKWIYFISVIMFGTKITAKKIKALSSQPRVKNVQCQCHHHQNYHLLHLKS